MFQCFGRVLSAFARKNAVECSTARKKLIFNSSLPSFLIYFKVLPILGHITRRFPRSTVSFIFPVVCALSFSKKEKNEVDEVIKSSDALFDAAKFKESCEILEKFKDQDNDEILWRLSRGLYNLTKASNVTKDEINTYINEADEFIKRALVLNDNNYAVQKWSAILLDAKTTQEGTKAKIASLPQFRNHIERAIALNPTDATSIHMLGSYFYNIADLAWYQKKIASALFGKVPDASFQEALAAFNLAEETSPNFYSANLLMLGKTYNKLGLTDSARHWLQRASTYTAKTDEDKAVIKEAIDILKSL